MKLSLIAISLYMSITSCCQQVGDTVGIFRIWGTPTRVLVSLNSFKDYIRLNNVSNTSPMSLPIGTATQTALNLKHNLSDSTTYQSKYRSDTARNNTYTSLAGKQASGNYLLANGSAAALTNFPTLNQNTSGTAAGLSIPLSFANGGISASAATSATTGTITVNMTTSVITCTPTGNMTLNASGGVAGQIITFSITTSGTTSFTLTFGTNFRKVGTLATGTTSARFFTVTFRCLDGTIWTEISRTAAQT